MFQLGLAYIMQIDREREIDIAIRRKQLLRPQDSPGAPSGRARPEGNATTGGGKGQQPLRPEMLPEPAQLHDVVEALAAFVVVERILPDLLRPAVVVVRRINR